MKKQIQNLVLAVLMVFGATLVSMVSVEAKADSSGVAELRLLEDKFRSVDPKNDAKVQKLLESAAKAVANLSSDPEKPLDTIQIKELVQLLKASVRHDTNRFIIDENSTLFSVNEKEIREELKKLAPKEAKAIGLALDIGLADLEGSDDAPNLNRTKKK